MLFRSAALTDTLLRRFAQPDLREPEDFSDASGSVLVIGFGRFGQIVSQCLLAEGIDVTTIDNDPEMMESAAGFGFKVYYGDGTRLDVLRAAGASEARLIAVCIDDREAEPYRRPRSRRIFRRKTLCALFRSATYPATSR